MFKSSLARSRTAPSGAQSPRILAASIVAAFALIAVPAARADLYVTTSGSDLGSCSQLTPCRTFDVAYDKAATNDVVHVAGGSYGAQTLSANATKTANTSYADGVRFVTDGAAVSTEVSFLPGKGVSFDGFTFDDPSRGGSIGAEMKGASRDISITNSIFNGWVYMENSSYVQLDNSEFGPRAGSTGGALMSNGDWIDVYQQAGQVPNDHISITRNVIHGLRAPSASAHPDAIQTNKIDGAASVTNMVIARNTFYDNECMNLRTDPGDTMLVENNFFGKVVTGISGCGYYAMDVWEANATVRYNTFEMDVQVQPSFPTTQSWVGNLGTGMSTACGVANASTVMQYNVWTKQKCSATDRQVTSLGLAGGTTYPGKLMLAAGSAAIDQGDPGAYPATDNAGDQRFTGTAPDAGADEYGGTVPPADTTPPDTSITSAPSGSTTATSASLGFSATETATFACRIDGGAWTACSSPQTYSGLAVGAHTFDVRATDTAGNVDASPATAAWTITAATDTTPPNTSITSAPSGSTTATTASLAFSATETVTFECRMDGGAWGACTSPKVYSGLALGAHTFDVRATDLAGNMDLTPASAGWTVTAGADTTPPDTSIVSGPSGSTTSTAASLAFSATEPATFECRVDGGAWGACTSPKAYSGLAVGAHTFDVRATDGSGNTDLSPATRAWTVTAAADITPPDTSITSGPTGSGTGASAALGFTASEAGSTFACRLDGGTWGACTSPKSYSAMSVGAHTFDVRATDAAGNTDASPATRTWTVVSPTDATPPDTSITSGPAASTTATTASVSFTATETGSTFQCRLDGGAWNACASPEGESGLAVGPHTIDVRATDTAGNADPTPATWSWTIVAPAPPAGDTTAPDTQLTSGPTTVTTSRSATFEFSATESPVTYRCSLDGSKWSNCTSPKGYSSLSRGKHTIRMRATDAAGNTDATPASYTWSIVRRSWGATYSFEPLSGHSRTPVQAGSLEGACALVSGSHARLGVRLGGLSVRRGHSAIRVSGKVPELARDGVNARVRVSVRSHGRWHLITSRRVHVRFDGSFRVKAPRRGGKLKVTAVARCS